MREASRRLLSEITACLDDLQASHPMQGVEDLNANEENRHKLHGWLEDALGVPHA